MAFWVIWLSMRHGHGLEPEMEHELVRLGYGVSLLDTDGRLGHVIPGRFFAFFLEVELGEDSVAYLGERLVAHAGAGGVSVASAAESRTHGAHVDRVGSGARHDLDAVVHAADGEEDVEFLHLHHLVGEEGEIVQVGVQGRFGEHHVRAVDVVGLRGLEEGVQGADVLLRHGEGRLFGNDVDVHAASEKPARGREVPLGDRREGEGTRVRINAEPEDGSCLPRDSDVQLLYLLNEQRGDGAADFGVADMGVHVVARLRVVIPDLDACAGIVEERPDMAQP